MHFEVFPEADSIESSPEALAQIEGLIESRHVIQKAIEEARQAKTIARNDEAVIELAAPEDAVVHQLADQLDLLKEFFIVSDLKVVEGDVHRAAVSSSGAGKCARCWRYVSDVGNDATHLPNSVGDALGLCHWASPVVS